jgi:hypothetical protein
VKPGYVNNGLGGLPLRALLAAGGRGRPTAAKTCVFALGAPA